MLIMETLRIAATLSFSVTVKERHSRIKHVLAEIRRERPLGKCPLFKMSLTFPSFVWAPIIDSVYSFGTQQTLNNIKGADAASKKPLLKSHSITSLKSPTSREVAVGENYLNQAAIPVKVSYIKLLYLEEMAELIYFSDWTKRCIKVKFVVKSCKLCNQNENYSCKFAPE